MTLRPIETQLVEELFVQGGYVLEFTNRTFFEFFQHEVGVDIYDDVYAFRGGSKGKRLIAFTQKAQPKAIAKALAGLWEFLDADRPESATADNRRKLSAIIERLGGAPLPGATVAQEPKAAPPLRPSEGVLVALEAEFLSLEVMDDRPQERGYAFERFLKRWFDTWGLDARASFRTIGEQIDGSFQHDGTTYLVEAKWHRAQTDATMLHSFQGKIEERPIWTRGLHVSHAGYSGPSSAAFTSRRIILMDGQDIYIALSRGIDPGLVIREKARAAAERKNPFAKVLELFP
ncbi:restriction endonuclease [Sinorhizobium meliloti]|uniref:restriction endonuclease n=1 Tax=Rhizobium meliloti TaxID=382 RepID=UPI003DA14FC7